MMSMSDVIRGSRLEVPRFWPTAGAAEPVLHIPLEGESGELCLSEDTLSKHILIAGGTGSGKTNLFKQVILSLSAAMTQQDVMVIFDTKGDYLSQFYRDGDIIICSDDSLFPPRYNIDYWNIFEETLISARSLKENVNEISKTLFYEQIRHATNPFFPNAAKDIFYAYLLACSRRRLADPGCISDNRELVRFFDEMNISGLNALLERYPDLKSIRNYISHDGPQTQGVLSEVTRLVRDIFIGNFAQSGGLSIQRAIREKGNRRIFVEYDLGIGNVLSPIYRLLIDLAIKEALCRERSEGNVYFILDEFRLLPHLQHIDDGINFGRSQGAKFVLGLQNIQQIRDAYGENIAGSILSGLSTKFLFRVNDHETREYIKNLLGKNRYVEVFASRDQTRGLVEQVIEGNVAEDWVIGKLPTGTAIYTSVGGDPGILSIAEYGRERPTFAIRNRELAVLPVSEPTPPGAFQIRKRNQWETAEVERVTEGRFSIRTQETVERVAEDRFAIRIQEAEVPESRAEDRSDSQDAGGTECAAPEE